MISADPSDPYDSGAGGPLACFSYVPAIGLRLVSVAMAHTNPPAELKSNEWPATWESTGLRKLWRYWSTTKYCSPTIGTQEHANLNPAGRRQGEFGTCTVSNDLPTLNAVYAVFEGSCREIKKRGVKGMRWTLVLQPLLPQWARLGSENPLGFQSSQNKQDDKPLAIVSFSADWDKEEDDEWVASLIQRSISQMEDVARERACLHRYKYMNYCGSWQKPFEGYGEGEHAWLKEVAKKYDEDGLFQQACVGGFKL